LPEYEELLNELSDICGIVPEYYDIFGTRHEASIATKTAILTAMGLKTGNTEDLHSEIAKARLREWKRFIEPVIVFLSTEQPLEIILHTPLRENDESNILVKLALGDEGNNREEFAFGPADIRLIERRVVEDVPHVKIGVTINAIKDIGYYDLDVLYKSSNFGLTARSKLIITPESCYIPDHMDSWSDCSPESRLQPEKSKTWGLCINLYSLTSGRNWGIGDFGDLKNIGEWTAALGGGFIGINPLHSIPNMPPCGISPYSPLSRLYKNPIYLDMESIPDVMDSNEAGITIQAHDFQEALNGLRSAEFIDYERVAALKTRILHQAFEYFYVNHYLKNTPRAEEFRRYAEAGGKVLDDFALFSALQQDMNTDCGSLSWRNWPEEYRERDSAQVREYLDSNTEAALFHKYVQWLIDEQHGAISERLADLGMPIGLYHDLAVGSSDGGFDTWIAHDIIADGMDVGAPPDDFNPTGQNWGFPPAIPEKMRASGYEFLITTIRQNMRHSGALRIDHALGMFRLFWIPKGMNPEHGAYVKYPSEDILRIIALESVRNSSMIIGEDLGTVGEDVRETLVRFRMLGYKLLYFERNYPDPSFKMPARYSDLALCAVTTHDLPTLYGFWEGRDIEARTCLGLYPNDEFMSRQISERRRDKALLLQALKSEGLLPDTFADDQPDKQDMISALCLTIYEFLARTPCRLLAVNLDDMIGALDQQNMPGTIDAYPNWSRKTPIAISTIMQNRSFLTLSKLLKKNHR
jgi:4-alpha-glucanotransferase